MPTNTTPAEKALTDALLSLYRQAGNPSTRTVAKAAGLSHTTVAMLLRPGTVPTWRSLSDVVRALNGSEETFKELWIDASESAARLSSGNFRVERLVITRRTDGGPADDKAWEMFINGVRGLAEGLGIRIGMEGDQ